MTSPADGGVPSRYERFAKIATGGMATVFVGRARGAVGFSRLVAIKCPHPFVSDDPALRKGLEHEARIASMIHHPHVVSVVDVELRGDELALILDYVDGGALSELAAHATRTGTPLPAGVAVRVVLDVASGLHAAHALCDRAGAPLGIVHRDVSPQNVLVGLDGLARLTDFGIAKVAAEHEHTATNVMKGKLAYLPPEYVESRRFDARSDAYALAVVAWEALAGRRLFRGATELETLRQILEHPVPSLSSVRGDLAPLDDVLARALARDPARRFESVAAFAHALEACARRHLHVASYAEVAAIAEAAVGAVVRSRHDAVASSTSSPGTTTLDDAPLSARDAVLTLSLSRVPLAAAGPGKTAAQGETTDRSAPGASAATPAASSPEPALGSAPARRGRAARLAAVTACIGLATLGVARAFSNPAASAKPDAVGALPRPSLELPSPELAAPAPPASVTAPGDPAHESPPSLSPSMPAPAAAPASASASARPVTRPLRRRPAGPRADDDHAPPPPRAPPNPYTR